MIATAQASKMAGSESIATTGARRSQALRQRIAADLTAARVGAGLSVREVARKVA